jgi:gamma-glutamylcyclotransferase (GGCT)/AIG2-like uncharacterized protein YtfP
MAEKIKCFVYGTLRRGDYNHARTGGKHDDDIKMATAQGAIYHLGPWSRLYPVSKFDEEGTIIGEVHEFSTHRWAQICSMEQGAGYELRVVEATYEDGSTEHVYAWHYRRPPGGPRIMSGDWFDRSFDPDDEDEDYYDDDDE